MKSKEVFINKNLLTAMKVILDGNSSLPDAEVVSIARKLLTLLYKEKLNKMSIRDKVIEVVGDWQEEHDNWESPEGKLIPYLRFSKFIMPENNDFDRYHIAVTIWAKNVSVEIIESCGECGPEIDSEDRWAMIKIYRIAKVSHAEFIERSDELIQQANRILYEKFNP